MKQVLKFSFFGLIFLACAVNLRAQSCTTGYCPATITVHHKAGSVSPVTVDITYGVVASTYSGTQKCWITRNLGATTQATSATDATDASSGWVWQFNRKQGYQHIGATRTPNTTWITSISENSDFTAANDPCTLLLGSTWRIPTMVEWNGVNINASLGNGLVNAFATPLKFHAGGQADSNGNKGSQGTLGQWWASTQYDTSVNGYRIYIITSSSALNNLNKVFGVSLRCLRDY